MAAGMVAGLALSGGQPAATTKVQPAEREVYVNLDKLSQLHPAWELMSMTKSTIADARAGMKPLIAAGSNIAVSDWDQIDSVEPDTALRERLSSDAAKLADESLRELENQQRLAVDSRLRLKRETMEKSAESEVVVRVKEIEDEASASAEQVARKYCPDRINAELKVSALKTESGSSGVDENVTKSKLEVAQAELDRINSECSSEANRVWDDAQTQIDSLLIDTSTRMDAALSIYESAQVRKIDERVASSRNEILDEMMSLYEPAELRGTSMFSLGENRTVVASHVTTDSSDLGDWQSNNAGLRQRIRRDVKNAVAKIAKDEGVRVVFVRDSSDMPDETSKFAQLMARLPWHGCGPVISAASGS